MVYHVFMFLIWALDQQDRDDSVGLLTRTMWQDYNAGCAGPYKTAVEWKEHFEQKHPSKFEALLELLGDAYVEYCTELKEQKETF
jgi:hypothetical protein